LTADTSIPLAAGKPGGQSGRLAARTTGGQADRPPGSRGSEYAELTRAVKQAGLLKRRPAYYGVKISLNFLLLAAGWTTFAILGHSWWQLLVAAFLAVMFTQTAFIGHDAGHRQISGSRRTDDLVGRVHGNLLIGLSYGWWIAKHNRHHAHPNQVGRDPDIAGRAIAFTEDQARPRPRLGAWLARSQAWLFFPMLLLEGLHLHVAGIRALRERRSTRAKLAEAGLLAAHIGGYLAALFLVLAPVQAVAFLAVHQGLFGIYMGSSFAPNHKGMPVSGEDDKTDYLRSQVLTSRNIRGGWLTDFALGGLNYQIEHHLFPSMPRPSLRNAQATVRAFCARHGVSYCETGLLASYAQVLRHLHTAGRPGAPIPVKPSAARPGHGADLGRPDLQKGIRDARGSRVGA
jgi:fatty acid desaturase